MNDNWKCETCQEIYSKLVSPFEGSSEKYCLSCFSFGLGLTAASKPNLTEYYNLLANKTQKQMDQSEPNSIIFISKNTDKKANN